MKIAEEIKNRFNPKSVLQLQWDGKLLPDPENPNNNVDRLPVLVSCHETEQLLGIPKFIDGTGESMATAIIQLLRDWNIPFDRIGGLVFDTTS